jgi:hypothetical protein
MTQKYVKPVARNLGDIPSAQGLCVATGSAAHNPGAGQCAPGLDAIGAYCGFGGPPQHDPAIGCQTGTLPGFNGCDVGQGNTSSCSLGANPL